MSVNQIIINALSPFGFPVVPDLYRGAEKRYITFNYADDRAKEFADNTPLLVVAYMQIHLFVPLNENYLSLKKQVRQALFQAGFTYPVVTIDTEKENNIRHIIFECEIEMEE